MKRTFEKTKDKLDESWLPSAMDMFEYVRDDVEKYGLFLLHILYEHRNFSWTYSDEEKEIFDEIQSLVDDLYEFEEFSSPWEAIQTW